MKLEMINIFEHIIERNDLVFDVGSNIGDKSENFLRLGAKVVAFEPQLECCNYSINRFQNNSNFVCENIGLDSSKGFSTIHIASYHSISSMSQEFITESKKERFQDYNWNNQRQIQTDTLDNLIEKYGRPKFIKIDVEGYELNVLKGLSHPIEFISIEFNPELCKETVKCIEYLEELNNDCLYNYGYRNDEHFKFENWISKEEIVSYLQSVNDFKFEFGDVYCKNVISKV